MPSIRLDSWTKDKQRKKCYSLAIKSLAKKHKKLFIVFLYVLCAFVYSVGSENRTGTRDTFGSGLSGLDGRDYRLSPYHAINRMEVGWIATTISKHNIFQTKVVFTKQCRVIMSPG